MAEVDRSIQKKVILKKWDELIQELSIYLECVKAHGGTMGHKVGGIIKVETKMKEHFKDL